MGASNDSQKIVVWVLKIGLLVVPFLPLLVTRSLFFPFITGKNFAFRIIIEVLLVLWIWLMLTNREYRPRSSVIVWAVSAALVVLALSTIFGIWPHKAFWSNFERMEGLWAHLHYFVFFLMLGSVFREWRDWQRFFFVSLGVSVVMSFYGLLQLLGRLDINQGGVRLDGTMGNATYLAIYLIFHVFLFAFFFFKTNNRWLRIAFVAAALFELFIVYHTATRGAILGVLAGLIVFALINALWSSGRIRKAAFILLLIGVLTPVVFVAVKDADFITNNDVLARFSSISLEETTTQSRFIIWGMALDAWKERPVLGWGPESFVYLFSKEYDARLWRQEPWFDRAHNVPLDWLTASGLVGLLAYLSIFLAVLLIVRKLFKAGIFKATTVGVFAGLFTAYFVHNLFVFDNFTSYFLFFSVLAYVHWQYTSSSRSDSSERPLRLGDEARGSPPKEAATPGVLPEEKSYQSSLAKPVLVSLIATLMISSIYLYNIKPILAAKSIIDTLRLVTYSQTGARVRDLNEGRENLRKGINYNTFGTTEIREQLAQYADRINRDPATPPEEKVKFLKFALEEMQEQVERFPFDVRAKIFLATLHSFSGNHQQAVAAINEAITISPQRQQFYFLLGELYFRAGEEQLALQAMKTAYELDPENPRAVHNYAIMAIFNAQQEFAENLLQQHFGETIFTDRRYINAYGAIGEFNKLVLVWEKLVAQQPNNLEYRLGLTSSYLKIFEDQKAIEQLQTVITLNPAFKAQGEAFIEQIRDGTILR